MNFPTIQYLADIWPVEPEVNVFLCMESRKEQTMTWPFKGLAGSEEGKLAYKQYADLPVLDSIRSGSRVQYIYMDQDHQDVYRRPNVDCGVQQTLFPAAEPLLAGG